MIGTIASEFACYSFEQLASYSEQKLKVLFVEALRQRTSKYNFLSLLINKAHQDTSDQEALNKIIRHYLDPYTMVGMSDSGWDVLKARTRR